MRLGPRYHVLDEIAAGGMGVVLLALRREATGVTPVAIKQMHAHLVDDEEIVASFVDEARIASRIVHPNIVRVQDVEMLGDRLVIVMEYVEGLPLRNLVRARPEGLPVPIVRRILVDALNGLHAAHELADEDGTPLGIVHRDVSPHNLLVCVNGLTRVADFGIAMAVGRIAATKTGGAVKGKLQYLSPEQVFRKGIDRRTDVFAAGIVTWEALVGRRLFDAGTEGETLAMIIREPIAPPSVHRPDIPFELEETCLRALERDPARRFATAYDFARALEEGGPLATREEVEQLVLAEIGPILAARRQLIAAASVEPFRETIEAEEDAPHAPQAPYTPRARQKTSAPTFVLPRSRRSSPIALITVGSICVTGGLIAGFFVRERPTSSLSTATSIGALAADGGSTYSRSAEPVPESTSSSVTAGSQTAPAETSPPTIAKPAPGVPPHRNPRGGTRPAARADAGRGRPFMPDDL